MKSLDTYQRTWQVTTKKPRYYRSREGIYFARRGFPNQRSYCSFIRRLVGRGDIEGIKIGRNWVTTREAIQGYLEKERRPGPKPKR